MSGESPFYDPMLLRNAVDDIYSSHETLDEVQALRVIIREKVYLPGARRAKVHTIMNDLVAELFGERGRHDHLNDYVTLPRRLNHNTTAEDEVTVVENS